jgi:type II secretory pathway pseudopilin PulG
MEMMVVVGVIVLLLGVVLLVGQGALETARVKDTQALIGQLDAAIDAYRTANPYRNVNAVQRRYGPNPPDDLMCYTPQPEYGVNGTDIGMPNIMPGGKGSFWSNAQGIGNQLSDAFNAPNYVPHGDIKALVWALRSQPESRSIYDGIAPRFKVGVSPDAEFFERLDGLNCNFAAGVDSDVQFLVDSWEKPLSYYAVRDAAEEPTDTLTAHAGVARRLVALNKVQPVIMSYGPNGDTQLGSSTPETLEQQYLTNLPAGGSLFPNPLNEDNVFADDNLALKLREEK